MSRCSPALTALLLGTVISLHAVEQPAELDLRAKNQPLSTVLETIADQCSAGLVVQRNVHERLDEKVTLIGRKVTWAEATRWLADEYRLTMKIVGEHLQISDADLEFRARLVSHTYDIRTLTLAMGSFPGPDLDIPEPGGVGSRLLPPIEPDSVQPINDFVELIQRFIAPTTWTIEGVGIKEFQTSLIIIQVPEIHQRIAEFIAQLERTAARQVVVRCYRLPAAAPLPSVLDANAWTAVLKTVAAPVGVVLSSDEQRNHHFSGTQRLIIADADVNQEAFDPIVSLISEGLAVDVETHVTNAGVVTTTRLTTASKLNTTLSVLKNQQGQQLTPLDLVDLHQDRIRDTRVIPSGGAAIYPFAGQFYALSVEVLDFTKKP